MKTKLLSLFILASSLQLANAQQWFYYKEFPVNVTPKKITSNEIGTMYMITSDFDVYNKPYGGEWNKISDNYIINPLSISVDKASNVVYVGSVYSGLYYSSDNGQDWDLTWTETNPVTGHHEGYSCLTQTNTPGKFFGGFTVGSKVTLFTNYGASSQVKQITSGFSATPFSLLYTTDNTLLVGTNSGIWLSTNDGNSFTQSNLSSGDVIDITEGENGRLYALKMDGYYEDFALFYSDDYLNWTEISLPDPDEIYTTLFYDSFTESLWLGSREGIYKTTVNDIIWEDQNLNNSTHSVVQIISDQNEGLYNFSLENIVQKLNTAQSGWEQDIDGISGIIDNMVFDADNTLFVSDEFYSNKVFSLEAQGESWDGTGLGNVTAGVKNVFVIDDKIFGNTTRKIYRSDDQGQSFTETNVPSEFSTQQLGYIDLFVKGGQGGIYATHTFVPGKIFGSDDEGQNWEMISDFISQDTSISISSFCQNSNGRFFVKMIGQSTEFLDKIYTSADGDDWEIVAFDYENISVDFFDSDLISYGDKSFTVDNQRVYEIKENEGVFSLELLNTPFVTTQNQLLEFKYTPEGNFIITTHQQGVYQSFDETVSWENIAYPSSVITDNSQLDVIEDYDNIPFIIINEGNNMNIEPGIYYYIQNVVLSTDEHTMANSSVIMYPNPVKTKLFIQSDKSVESISVFDYSGKKVLSLNNQNIEKIDVSGLTQGIYIVYIKDIDGNHHWSKFIKQ